MQVQKKSLNTAQLILAMLTSVSSWVENLIVDLFIYLFIFIFIIYLKAMVPLIQSNVDSISTFDNVQS